MYTLAEAQKTDRFSESWTSFGRRIPPHWLTDGDLGLIAGAGGILSTATDVSQWAKVLLGITDGTQVGIPETVLRTCMTPQALVDSSGLTYGFGWFQQEFQGIPVCHVFLPHSESPNMNTDCVPYRRNSRSLVAHYACPEPEGRCNYAR
jgi:hypothetical protein